MNGNFPPLYAILSAEPLSFRSPLEYAAQFAVDVGESRQASE